MPENIDELQNSILYATNEIEKMSYCTKLFYARLASLSDKIFALKELPRIEASEKIRKTMSLELIGGGRNKRCLETVLAHGDKELEQLARDKLEIYNLWEEILLSPHSVNEIRLLRIVELTNSSLDLIKAMKHSDSSGRIAEQIFSKIYQDLKGDRQDKNCLVYDINHLFIFLEKAQIPDQQQMLVLKILNIKNSKSVKLRIDRILGKNAGGDKKRSIFFKK